MKLVLAVASLLVASVSFARVDVDALSWGQILSAGSGYAVSGDQIIFQTNYGTVFKDSTDRSVCTNKEQTKIYASTHVDVCADEDQKSCDWMPLDLEADVKGYSYECNTYVSDSQNGQKCKAPNRNSQYWDKVAFMQYPERSVTITTKPKHDSSGNDKVKVLGVKAYTIPVCPSFVGVSAN